MRHVRTIRLRQPGSLDQLPWAPVLTSLRCRSPCSTRAHAGVPLVRRMCRRATPPSRAGGWFPSGPMIPPSAIACATPRGTCCREAVLPRRSRGAGGLIAPGVLYDGAHRGQKVKHPLPRVVHASVRLAALLERWRPMGSPRRPAVTARSSRLMPTSHGALHDRMPVTSSPGLRRVMDRDPGSKRWRWCGRTTGRCAPVGEHGGTRSARRRREHSSHDEPSG